MLNRINGSKSQPAWNMLVLAAIASSRLADGIFIFEITMTKISWQCRFLVSAFGLLLAAAAYAQTKSDKPSANVVSIEIIQSRLKQLEDSRDLDETTKAKIREYYQQAIRELDSGQTWLASASRFEKMSAAAADDLPETKSDLAALPAEPSLQMPENIHLAQIDQLISKKQSELDDCRERLVELEAEPKRRASCRAEIPKLSSTARERLAQLDEQLQAPPPADEAAALTAPRRCNLKPSAGQRNKKSRRMSRKSPPTKPPRNYCPCGGTYMRDGWRWWSRRSSIGGKRPTGDVSRRRKSRLSRPGLRPPRPIPRCAAWPTKTPLWPKCQGTGPTHRR